MQVLPDEVNFILSLLWRNTSLIYSSKNQWHFTQTAVQKLNFLKISLFVFILCTCVSLSEKKDEKLLEVSLEAVASRVQELKESIQSFLAKLEHEQLTW